MRLRLKDDPREWRKSACLSALGLSVMSSLLRWRRILQASLWLAVLSLLGLAAVLAWFRPAFFRGFYRFSHRLGFAIVEVAGRIVLFFFFFLVLTPMGLLLRAFGKDPLRLKRPGPSETCWVECKESTPLDRMF